MSAIRCAVLCSTLLIAHGATAGEPATIRSVLRNPTLQAIVHQGVVDDPGILNLPWQRSGNYCYYRLGRIAEAMGDSPHKRAIRTYLLAEYFARTKNAAQQPWAHDIGELRAAANREYVRVEREGVAPEAGSIVPEVEALVQTMFDRLAQEEGAESALNEPLPVEPAAEKALQVSQHKISVTVPGTRIFCVTPFRYQLLTAFNQLGIEEQWGVIAENTTVPAGDFYFWVVRPDGSSTRSGKIHVGPEQLIQLPGA
jgi:hypothetical protein